MSKQSLKTVAPEHRGESSKPAQAAQSLRRARPVQPTPSPRRGPLDVPTRAWKAVIGWGGFAGGCILWGLTVVPVTILLGAFRPSVRERFNTLTRAGLRFYIKMLPFMRVRVERRRVDTEGRQPARILVANHQSLLDPIMLMSFEPCLSGPAKDYLFRWPGLGAFLRLARFYPSESSGRGILETMRVGVKQAIEQGNSLLFFPEGTRTRTGEMGDFQRGAFRMAVEYGLPIQPVVIEGIHEVLPPGVFLVGDAGRPDVRIVYLDPIEVRQDRDNARSSARVLAERVRTEIATELARLRDERHQVAAGL